ncbi:MAG TPA: SpoIIE family protein phosphatase, partial [Terracidiphilus sp.]
MFARLISAVSTSLLIVVCSTAVLTAEARAEARVVTIQGLGLGTTKLDGPWQFHIGDDLHWAQPGIDDATGHDGWETMLTDRPWGAQTHYAYAGFGWYRLHLHIVPAPATGSSYQLVLPAISDACEVYWNGVLVGRYGSLPPHASWPAASAPAVFDLPAGQDGTLAIRVFKGPLGSSSAGEIGGLPDTPIIGEKEPIAAWMGTWDYDFLRTTLYGDALNLLYMALGVSALLFWLRRRHDRVLVCFSLFILCPVFWTSVYLMRLPLSAEFTQFVLQELWELRNVALWFLLIDLLNLRARTHLVRWAKILAVVALLAAFLDGCLSILPQGWISDQTGEWIDAVFTVIVEPCDLFLLVLAAFGFRQKLDSARWIVAASASLSQLLAVVTATVSQGQRFTHWKLGQQLFGSLFRLGPVYISAQSLLDLLLIFSVVYAVYRYARDQQIRKAVLEQELASARELQQVLIPEKPPTLPGFTMSSAYHPALEVGGDFFQVIPLDGPAPGSTLIVLGDVSGKGLRAAMAVSLIVGAVRTLAETTSSPAEILAGLSRRLYGRLQDGFTTCLALRLDADGKCTISSAGHPPPYINDTEADLPGALPLGIDPSTVYDETTLLIRPGDRCALYTDGLLEARSASGEIFSFER